MTWIFVLLASQLVTLTSETKKLGNVPETQYKDRLVTPLNLRYVRRDTGKRKEASDDQSKGNEAYNAPSKQASNSPEDQDWDPIKQEVYTLCLDMHNNFRSRHYAEPLRYDSRLNALAQNHANLMVKKMAKLEQSEWKRESYRLGENVYYYKRDDDDVSARAFLKWSVDRWYSEIESYSRYSKRTPVNFLSVGYFTQLVWRDSRWLGLGMARLQDRDGIWHYITITKYDPKGNIYDIYPEMVLEPNKYGLPPKRPIPAIIHHELARYPEHDYDYNPAKQLPQVPGLPYPCPDFKHLQDTDDGAHILGDHFKGLFIPVVVAINIRNRLEKAWANELAALKEPDNFVSGNMLVIESDPDLEILGVNEQEMNRRIRTLRSSYNEKEKPKAERHLSETSPRSASSFQESQVTESLPLSTKTPHEEKSLNCKNPLIIEKDPLSTKTPNYEEKHLNTKTLYNKEKPLDDKTPNKEKLLDDETPNKEKRLDDNTPNKEKPLNDKTPNKEKSMDDNTPSIKEKPLGDSTPNKEKLLDEKTPNKEKPLDENTPNKEKPLNEKTPKKEKSLGDNTPNREKPILTKQPSKIWINKRKSKNMDAVTWKQEISNDEKKSKDLNVVTKTQEPLNTYAKANKQELREDTREGPGLEDQSKLVSNLYKSKPLNAVTKIQEVSDDQIIGQAMIITPNKQEPSDDRGERKKDSNVVPNKIEALDNPSEGKYSNVVPKKLEAWNFQRNGKEIPYTHTNSQELREDTTKKGKKIWSDLSKVKEASTSPDDQDWDPIKQEVYTLCLDMHNNYRSRHYAEPLRYYSRLNTLAQKDANHLVRQMAKLESPRPHESYRLGFNIHFHKEDQLPNIPAQTMVKMSIDAWYDEVESYSNYSSKTLLNLPSVCHFVQLVWRDTRWLGLGMAKLQDKEGIWHYVTVVYYEPRGIIEGLYPEMVLEANKYGPPPRAPVPPVRYHENARYPEHNFNYGAVELARVPDLPYPCPSFDHLQDTDNGSFLLGDHFAGLYIPVVLALEIRYLLEKNQANEFGKTIQNRIAIRKTVTLVEIPLEIGLNVMGVDLEEVNSRLRTFLNIDDGKQYPWEPDSQAVLDLNLKLHNDYRAKHYAPGLKYDNRLHRAAKIYANILIQKISKHGLDGTVHSYWGLGENLYSMIEENPGISALHVTELAVNSWYKDEVDNFWNYGEKKAPTSRRHCTGHFTQMIWRSTKYMGLGLAKSTTGTNQTIYVMVVEYDPPGNIQGEFRENVLEPRAYQGRTLPRVKSWSKMSNIYNASYTIEEETGLSIT